MMKHTLFFCLLWLMVTSIYGQQQLEFVIPVGLSGVSALTEENYRQAEPEADFSFRQGISTGVLLRYAFGLQNRFHVVASVGYQRWSFNYSRSSETTEPVFLERTTDYYYTDHAFLAGLNYRYRIIEDGSQSLAIQAKTQMSYPFAGEYRLEDSRLFDPAGEPETSETYFSDLVYMDNSNLHLQIGGGIIYTYHFSRWSLITEVNYLYKYHLTGHSRNDGFAIDWQDIHLGVGVGYILGSREKIEGNQDAFFKVK